MKILIVGDSFCNQEHHIRSANTWTRQLETMIPDCEVTCLGKGGSSIFSAFTSLKTQLEKVEYDWYIFMFTQHTRFYMPESPSGGSLHHAQSLIQRYNAQMRNTDLYDEKVYNRLLAIKMYYEHLQQDSLDLFVFESVLEKSAELLKGKNYIFFPCFDSYQESELAVKHLGHHPFSAYGISQKENLNFRRRLSNNIGQLYWIEDLKQLTNHMSANGQRVLAQYMLDLINNGKSDITLKDVEILKGSFTTYYRPIADTEFNFD